MVVNPRPRVSRGDRSQAQCGGNGDLGDTPPTILPTPENGRPSHPTSRNLILILTVTHNQHRTLTRYSRVGDRAIAVRKPGGLQMSLTQKPIQRSVLQSGAMGVALSATACRFAQPSIY